MLPQDHFFLLHALSLAQSQRGFCAPNPAVGAVIVDTAGRQIAEGIHRGAGQPHAEIEALCALSASGGCAKGATIYVTLEPCCHWGRTPPCTQALIKAGVGRVVYGYRDPNPLVEGQGAAELQAAGIRCEYLSLPEIDLFYRSYHHWQKTALPFVTAKIALTLDGKIAGPHGERMTITGAALSAFTHTQRKVSDALLTTAKTIKQDHPEFNARCEGQVFAKPLYILDRELTLSPDEKIFKTAKSITLFYSSNAAISPRAAMLAEAGARCIAIDEYPSPSRLNLAAVLQQIGQDGIHDLWVEAGGQCFAALSQGRWIQRAFIYMAPFWAGQGQSAFPLAFSLPASPTHIAWQQYGQDVLCEMHFV